MKSSHRNFIFHLKQIFDAESLSKEVVAENSIYLVTFI